MNGADLSRMFCINDALSAVLASIDCIDLTKHFHSHTVKPTPLFLCPEKICGDRMTDSR